MDTIFNIQSYEEFQKTLQEVLNRYCYSPKVIEKLVDSSIIKAAKDDIKMLLVDSHFDFNKVPELLVDKSWNQERIAFLIELLNEKKTEILYAYLTHQNSEYGETLTGFDWLLKIVLGTSELNTLKYPILQLILSTDNNEDKKKVIYDINKETLLKTIKVLENLEER